MRLTVALAALCALPACFLNLDPDAGDDDDSGGADDDDAGRADDDSGGADDDAGGADDDDGDGGGDLCLDSDVGEVLASHLDDIIADVVLTAGHASSLEAVSYFPLPGWAVAGPMYAFLIGECTGRSSYDAWCDGGVCWQLECNGKAPSWTQHGWLDDTPVDHDGWTYASGQVGVTWPGAGDVLQVQLSMQATDPAGREWGMDGHIDYADGLASVVETYSGLSDAGDAVLDMDLDVVTEVTTGGVTIGETTVLTFHDGEHGLEPVHPDPCD